VDGAGDGAGVRALADASWPPLAAWGGALAVVDGGLVRVTKDGSREDLKALSPGLTISALTISADGASIGLGYDDGQVALSSLKDGRNLWIRPGPPARIITLSISADGGLLVSGDVEGIIQLWEVATGGLQATLLVQRPASEAEADPAGALQWLVLSSDGRIDGTSIARTMVRWRSGEDIVTTDRPWRERRDRGILDRILGPKAPPGK
jgi:WD40 repeat protein